MFGYCLAVGFVALSLLTAGMFGTAHSVLVWRRYTLNQHYATQSAR